MKLITVFPRILQAMACVTLAFGARAEAEYEYAKRLIQEINTPSFSTDDLVERMAARLEEAPGTKLESKLIRATLLRRQAADAPPEKRIEKLKAASDLYKEIVSNEAKAKFRLISIAEKDSDTIQMEILHATLASAKGNPEKEKSLRAEAGTIYDKKAGQFKDTAEKIYPEFKA